MHTIPLDIETAHYPNRYSISGPTIGKGRYVRPAPGAEHFGIVTLRLEPHREAIPFLLTWHVTEEQIPQIFLPAVVEGIRYIAQQERPEGGWLTHIKVDVIDGACHPIDSRASSYIVATRRAFEDALTHIALIPFST